MMGGERVPGRVGIEPSYRICAVIIQGQRRRSRKGREIGAPCLGIAGHARQGKVAVDARPAVAGGMFADRHDSGGAQPLCHGAAQARHAPPDRAEGAVADHVVGPGSARSSTGAQTESNPARAALGADQRRPLSQAARKRGAGSRHQRRRSPRPGWARQCGGPQPGDAAALLVDHHDRFGRKHRRGGHASEPQAAPDPPRCGRTG